ncbi:NAD(P)-dependent oxidoreductase [Candidatus Roizmanbacteria bacterium]|nr:NAD(P)-dependent oxidoreductase [Candidatus Roizmanbacteria bacterium]
MKKKVLILGSSGFIGKNLSEAFKNKYYLLSPGHSELDLTDEPSVSFYFRSHPVDVVINAVVVGGSRKEEKEENAFRNNLLMFFNIVNNSRYYKKLIHFGSGAEYGKRRPLIKVSEDNFGTPIPTDDYGFFKYVCSKYIERSDKIVNLRIFGLFGKYEDYRYRFISNAICLNLLGRPISMNQNVFFDYVFIDDFTKIVEHFIIHKTKNKFFNIGTGKKIDLLTIAEKINSIADKKSAIIIRKAGLNNEYSCDNKRLLKMLNEFKFTPIDEAIRKLYAWYKENLPTIKLSS